MHKVKKKSGHPEVIPTIQKIIADQLKMKPADVRLNALLQNDLGIASLDAMEIILSIEEAFEIDIPDSQARQAKTPGDIANFVAKQIEKTGA